MVEPPPISASRVFAMVWMQESLDVQSPKSELAFTGTSGQWGYGVWGPVSRESLGIATGAIGDHHGCYAAGVRFKPFRGDDG